MKKRVVHWAIVAVSLVLPGIQVAHAQTGVYTLDGGSGSETSQSYAATLVDQSAVLVTDYGKLILTLCTLTKTGDASDVTNSSQYGINAGVLADSGAEVTMTGGSVTTNASGGNGLFATGINSWITMGSGTISTTGASAHGIDVTYGALIALTNVNVTTQGANSSALATDFGGGTVVVTGGTIVAADTDAGSRSAGMYSTGSITVYSATVSSSGDCGGVIDGANSISLVSTALTGELDGFKIWKTAPAAGAAEVSIDGGSVTSTSGDAFYITGSAGNAASAIIGIAGGCVIHAGSGNIVRVDDGSSATVIADSESLTGNFLADNTSALSAGLYESTRLTGRISGASLTIDPTSSWTVAAGSSVAALTGAAIEAGDSITNITGNGQNVFYDSANAANRYLGGQTYHLVNGGVLTPTIPAGVRVRTNAVPAVFALRQNYPNPFNPTTTIEYRLPNASFVRLAVYNVLGEEVRVLVNATEQAGSYFLRVEGSNLASGIYFYKLTAGSFAEMKKMVLLR